MIGWVAGTPVPRERLDERVRELRTGRPASRLPTVGSKEDRQFLRWTAQVLLTEELCRVELARLGKEPIAESTADLPAGPTAELPAGPTAELAAEPIAELPPEPIAEPPRALTQAESLHLGSINAAAWSPAMSELFERVTAPSELAAAPAKRRTWYRVTHSMGATPLAADAAVPQALGWTTLDDLPATLAAELRAVPPGIRVGPIRSGIGWHFATVTATEVRAAPAPALEADAPRLTAFNRWLDQRRRALVTHAAGFEHPGDPSQPDNTHRH